MPPDESKGIQLDAIGSLDQRQLNNTILGDPEPVGQVRVGLKMARSAAVDVARRGKLTAAVDQAFRSDQSSA